MSSEREYTTMSKDAWGPGPWMDEPDKVQWVDDATGLDCLIVRNHWGGLCGYVGVPPGHALHGAAYDTVPVPVHGGLTYADRCDDDALESEGICHVPGPGRPADVWWFGFDCGHAFDIQPVMEMRMAEIEQRELRTALRLAGVPPWTYKTIDYVRSEVTGLARALAGAADADHAEG